MTADLLRTIPPRTERGVTGVLRNRYFRGEPLSPLTLSLVPASLAKRACLVPPILFRDPLAVPPLLARLLLLSPRGVAAGVLLLPPWAVPPACPCPRPSPSPRIPPRACLLQPVRAPDASFSPAPPGEPTRWPGCVRPITANYVSHSTTRCSGLSALPTLLAGCWFPGLPANRRNPRETV